jgi:hypothetical protein
MYPLPDLGGGTLLFTNETDSKTNEMAVMYIRCDSINLRGVSELHFVKTTARKGLSQ